MDEEKLIGWLVFTRLNLDPDAPRAIDIPSDIRVTWVDRGWAEVQPITETEYDLHITDEGCRVSDLAAPEWGVDPVGVC